MIALQIVMLFFTLTGFGLLFSGFGQEAAGAFGAALMTVLVSLIYKENNP
jgi:hypothetical protein